MVGCYTQLWASQTDSSEVVQIRTSDSMSQKMNVPTTPSMVSAHFDTLSARRFYIMRRIMASLG